MNLKTMVAALVESGMSQAAIAKACGTNQPTIFRAAHGKDVVYRTGREIENLYLRRIANKHTA